MGGKRNRHRRRQSSLTLVYVCKSPVLLLHPVFSAADRKKFPFPPRERNCRFSFLSAIGGNPREMVYTSLPKWKSPFLFLPLRAGKSIILTFFALIRRGEKVPGELRLRRDAIKMPASPKVYTTISPGQEKVWEIRRDALILLTLRSSTFLGGGRTGGARDAPFSLRKESLRN